MVDKLMLTALRPLILIDLWLRKRGIVRDRMFWADELAMKHGSLMVDGYYG